MKKFVLAAILFGILLGCGKEPQTLEELIQAGEKAFLEEDYTKARKYLAKAIEQKPSDRHLLFLLGTSCQRDYLYDSAFYYLKRLDLLYPDDREINQQLYKIAPQVQEWNSAIQAIQVLIKTGDPEEKYYRDLAELNLRIQNFEVSYHYFRKLHARDTTDADLYLKVANLATDLDSFDVAIAVIDTAIERFGRNNEFLLNKGLYLAAARRYAEAEKILRELVARDSTAMPFQINLAHVLASQNNRAKKEEALAIYQKIRTQVADIFQVDSLIAKLQEELSR